MKVSEMSDTCDSNTNVVGRHVQTPLTIMDKTLVSSSMGLLPSLSKWKTDNFPGRKDIEIGGRGAPLFSTSSIGHSSILRNSQSLQKEGNNSKLQLNEHEIAKPKRPLTAYNLFFRSERAKMVGKDFTVQSFKSEDGSGAKRKRPHRKTHGKVGFQEMAKIIGQKWRGLGASEKAEFESQASKDMKRYRSEMEQYRLKIESIGGRQGDSLGPALSLSSKSDISSVREAVVAKGNCLTGMSVGVTKNPLTTESHQEMLMKALQICQTNPVPLRTQNEEAQTQCVATQQCQPSRFSGSIKGSIIELENELRETLGSDVISFLGKLQENETSVDSTCDGLIVNGHECIPRPHGVAPVLSSFEPVDINGECDGCRDIRPDDMKQFFSFFVDDVGCHHQVPKKMKRSNVGQNVKRNS